MVDPAPYGADCPPPTSPITAAELRADFPAFADASTYPDSAIDFWLGIATAALPHWCGCTMYRLGLELYAAHNLILDAQATAQTAAGGIAAGQLGAVANKSVGPASIGYDNQIGSVGADAGPWDATVWGRRFYYLARQFGMGPIQVGAVSWPPNGVRPSGAWSGPLPYTTQIFF